LRGIGVPEPFNPMVQSGNGLLFLSYITLLEKHYAKEKEKSLDYEVFVQKETTVIKILTYNIMYHSSF
jgi:hypothetical protein